MAIEKVNNTTYNKGIAENYKNFVQENGAQKKTKAMMESNKEGVMSKGFKIDKKA